ncbi:ras-responsive element-binding protein 1 isoform X2 [Strongylocentrotus purpuratus]|uniref:C2H2-type domain-containing protein n=1 Tax=Strongylocentrotus purpuratus TaxID=7668 RepID=A0A7M7RE42_STRPU|nr:ras-responsive element-binding protein 1 isoform X2 [Strongylocentrotus purpuratus]
MSRRKQRAPARLSDDLEGEGTGRGKKAKSEPASEVTRRSSVKGRQSVDRKQPPARSVNGHSRERPTAKRRNSLAKDKKTQVQKRSTATTKSDLQNGDVHEPQVTRKSSKKTNADVVVKKEQEEKEQEEKEQEEKEQEGKEQEKEQEGKEQEKEQEGKEQDGIEQDVNGKIVDGVKPCDTATPEHASSRNADDDDDAATTVDDLQDSSVGNAGCPVSEAELAGGESALGGGGTTAGVDQVASSQQPMTGVGAMERGQNPTEEGEDGDTKLDDEAETSSSSMSVLQENDAIPGDQVDFLSAKAAAAAVVSGVALATAVLMEDELSNASSFGSGSMRGFEETGRGESATWSDRCLNQEGETQNGVDGGSLKARATSPTSSLSNDSTPSKNSMKRRRPFECPESLTCQVCNIDFVNAHELTLHVRTHNAASSHSCTMCGKKLSSTSSLDRHMLIHSGERPFTCPLCAMSFTTNGNMHRHLRTHEKGGELPPPDYVVKHDYAKPRKRVPSRRLIENLDMEGGSPQRDGQPAKKRAHHGEKKSSEKKLMVERKRPLNLSMKVVKSSDEAISDEPMDLSSGETHTHVSESIDEEKKIEEELSCPICGKTFLCRNGLQTHVEQHPNKVLECMICNATFRNQKGLRMHVHMAHRRSKAPSPITTGEKEFSSMAELGFAEFSSPKFALIAQLWCEKNSPRTTDMDSIYACKDCNKSFPCQSALNLHHEKSHSIIGDEEMYADSENIELSNEDVSRDEFLAALNLKPISPPQSPQKVPQTSPNKSPQKSKDNDKAESSRPAPILNSMLSRPSLASPEKAKSSLLQQHLQASPLLAMKHFSNPLGAQVHIAQTKSTPMKHSPVKGVTAGSVPQIKSEMDVAEGSESRIESAVEPKSGDVAMEMHTPREFANQNNSTAEVPENQAGDITAAEAEGDFVASLEEIEEEPCDLSNANKKKGTHTCKYCKKVFPFSSTLKVHTRSHMGLMPYKCMLCDYASADKSTLVRHMRTHSGERPYSCKVCDFAFTTKANCERHVRKRHNKNTKEEAEEVILHNPSPKHDDEGKYSSPCTVCKICDRDFKFFRDLQNHLRVHEKTPQKPFTCTKCQVGFSSLSNCARHIMRRHEEVKADEVETYITVFQHEDEKNAPIIKVPKFIKSESRSVTPVLDTEGEQVEPLDFSLKKSPENGSTVARVGQRRTSIFTEDTPIDLSMPKSALPLNFSVKPANSLGLHRFKEVYHKFYDEGSDALMCPHCPLHFKRGSHLKSHIRSHTNERPYRCHLCQAAFTMKANLEAHIVRRHNNSDECESQQSFIPKSATPMQFKLMAKSSSGHRFTSRASKTAVPLISPNTPVGASQQIKLGPSPHNSVGSDSSGELASVSKMLAATDSNQFKLFLSPPESRSPLTVSEIFRETDDDYRDEESQEMFTNVKEPPEVRLDRIQNGNVFYQDNVSDTMDLSMSVKVEEPELDQSFADDELGGPLQIVEDEKATDDSEKDIKEDKKERRGTKFESKQCCPYCGRRFPWISSLRRHILTHTGLKPYQCPQCGANFSTKSNCERHIVRRHGGARPGSLGGSVPGGQDHPFMCPECKGFKCTTRTQLQGHYEQNHPQIDFAGIYPEAKKVASTSVDIVNQQLDAKLASEAPLCLTVDNSNGEKSNDEDTTQSEDIPADLSTTHSKSQKKSKGVPLKVKMFTGKGVVKVGAVNEKSTNILGEDEGATTNQGSMVEDEARDSLAEEVSQGLGEEEGEDVDEVLEEEGMEGIQHSGDDVDETEPQLAAAAGLSSSNSRPRSKGKKNRARFECTQCCKRFKTAATLEKHEKVHEVEHPFHCTDCKATFTTKFNCHRHMMKLHKKSREEMANWSLKEDGSGSIKNSVMNGDNGQQVSEGNHQAKQELDDMSHISLNLGDSVSALGESNKGSRNGTPVPFRLGQKGKKRPSMAQLVKMTKSPKLDEALRTGAVQDLQGSTDKLMAVENWLNSDLDLQNGQMNGYGTDDEINYDGAIPILNPESPTSTQESQRNSATSANPSGSRKPTQQQGLYVSSFLEDEDSLVAQDVANPSDVFSGGQGEEKNDIISNLLGIQDSSVLDQMLESADSAARLLGVSNG